MNPASAPLVADTMLPTAADVSPWRFAWSLVVDAAGADEADALADARGTYFGALGAPASDALGFHAEMEGFLEWFILDRARPSPTVMRVLDGLSPENVLKHAPCLEALIESRVGVYEVRRVAAGGLKVRDVLTRLIVEVPPHAAHVSLAKGDLLLARLMQTPDGPRFSDSWQCLARPARKRAVTAIKLTRKALKKQVPGAEDALLSGLAEAQRRVARYTTLPPERLFAQALDKHDL